MVDESVLTDAETGAESEVTETEQHDEPLDASADDPYSAQQEADRQRAIKAGWRPEDKYKGKPGTWANYDVFLERHDRAERFRERDRQRDSEIAELRETVRRLQKNDQEHSQVREQITHQQLLANLADASERGDHAEVAKLTDQLTDLKVAARMQKVAAPAVDPARQMSEAAERNLNSFFADNPIFRADRFLERELAIETKRSAELDPTLRGRELLDEAYSIVKEKYPDRFTRKRGPPMAETEGSPGRTNGVKRSWDNLNDDARRELDNLIKTGETFQGMPVEKARAEILRHASDEHFRSRRG